MDDLDSYIEGVFGRFCKRTKSREEKETDEDRNKLEEFMNRGMSNWNWGDDKQILELKWRVEKDIVYVDSLKGKIKKEYDIKKNQNELQGSELLLKLKQEKTRIPLKGGLSKESSKYTLPEVDAIVNKFQNNKKVEYIEYEDKIRKLENIIKGLQSDASYLAQLFFVVNKSIKQEYSETRFGGSL